jgi:ankyrin repeat protein
MDSTRKTSFAGMCSIATTTLCIFVLLALAISPNWLRMRYLSIVNKSKAFYYANSTHNEAELIGLLKSGASITKPAYIRNGSANMNLPYLFLPPEYVQYALRHGANPNEKGAFGNTPLHYACDEYKASTVVEVLLDAGAKPNALGERNRTPLDYVKIDDADTLDLLLSRGAVLSWPPESSQPYRPALWESQWREYGLTYNEVSRTSALATKQQTVDQLLLMSIQHDSFNTTLMLEKYKPNPNQVNPDSGTPLIVCACGYGPQKSLIEELLRLGADINKPETRTGDTALHVAVRNHNYSVVKLLLEHGASKTIKNKLGQKPIDVIDPIEEELR